MIVEQERKPTRVLPKDRVVPGVKGRRLRFADDRLFFWVSFLPTAVITGTIVLLPILYTLILSLFSQNPLVGSSAFVGLDNYGELLQDPVFWLAFRNGIIYASGSTIVSTVVGIGAALLLNEAFWGRGFLRGVVIFPYIVPSIVVVFIWKFMFNSRGVVNDILTQAGILGEFIPWLGDQRFAMITVILISAWAWFPFATVSFLAALQNIPTVIYEAAAIDGAGSWRRFIALTLPLLTPVLIVVILIRSIWAFRNFDMIWLLTGGGPLNSTYILPIMAYQEAFGKFRMGYATAIATSLMIFLSLLAFVYFWAYSASKRNSY
ncbi:MAG: sugar ABC transporter permease [Chloroflexota bacterium]|nr:MAG: sugar ABC transporter permease [Chloroflexota bacterium]